MQLPQAGQLFQRKYKLQGVLGRGGFATVYRASDIEVGRDVAIKILSPGEDGYSAGLVSRFMREARVIAGLQDPHTITMFDFGRDENGLLYMVFEYVRGMDLSDVLHRGGPLNEEAVVHVLEQLLQSLREAHYAGVLHRDIKPANVLVYDYMGDPYRVKLLDFGIAKHALANDEASVNITRDGAMVGTPRYMSPEQIYGGDLTAASDLYSLGLLAHEMLKGAPAIEGKTSKEAIRAQLSDEPIRVPRQLGASEGLCAIIDRMTSRQPAARYSSAEEILRELEYLEPDATDLMAERAAVPAQLPERPATLVEEAFESPPDRQHAPVTRIEATPRPLSADDRPTAHSVPTREETLVGESVANLWVIAVGLAAGVALVAALFFVPRLLADKETDRTNDPLSFDKEELPVGYVEPDRVQVAEPPRPTESGSDSSSAAPAVDAGPSAPDAGTADASSDGATEPARSGCGDKAPWEGEQTLSVDVGFSRRYWRAYLPKGYEPNREYPVVVGFHNAFNGSENLVKDTRLQELADKKKFIFLAPNAVNEAKPWGASEVPFVKRLLEETASVACVDRSRVYAFGHGMGGQLVRNLMCEMPLSAGASSGAGVGADEVVCRPDKPVPFMYFQGMADPHVPARGGVGCTGGRFKSLADNEAHWRKVHACSDNRRTFRSHKGGTCYEWTCEKAAFASCQIKGGHNWPHAEAQMLVLPGCADEPTTFPFGETMWRFFEKRGHKLDVAEQ